MVPNFLPVVYRKPIAEKTYAKASIMAYSIEKVRV